MSQTTHTRNEVEQIVKSKPLYAMSCVNWKGKTKKTEKDAGGEYYSEIIASLVMGDEKLLTLPHGSLRDNFYFKSHDGNTASLDSDTPSNRKEELFCLEKYNDRNNEVTPFGKIINYQVNIFKYTKINVDLVAYDKDTDCLWLIEVKGHDGESPETLLRCALEIQTYYRCLQDCKDALLSTLSSKDEGAVTSSKTTVKKGVWIPKNSQPHKDYEDLANRPNLKKLLENWQIKVETY